MNKPKISVDFDGVICLADKWRGYDYFNDPLPWVKEFLQQLSNKYYIIIHTCRCNTELNDMPEQSLPLLANKVKYFMNKHSLKYDEIWCKPGKPISEFYIDDKALWVPKNPTRHDYEYALRKVL